MGSTGRADYGIDAPGVIRNLAIAGIAALLVTAAIRVGWLPPEIGWGSESGGGVRIVLTPSTLTAGIALCAAACGMYFGSKYGKIG